MTLRAARPAAEAFGPAMRSTMAWAAVILSVLGVTLGLRYGWASLRDYDKLRIRGVEVVGSERAAATDVSIYSGIRKGEAVLGLDLDAVQKSVKRHPWVDAVTVKRRLPDHVVIEVTEHQPRLLVALGELYVANTRGELFKRAVSADALALPVLTGLERDAAAREPEALAAQVRAAIELSAALEPRVAGRGRIDELHWDEVLGWSAILLPGGSRALPVALHLGREPLERLPTALAALDAAREAGQRPTVVWADGGKNSSFVQVRAAQRDAETVIATTRGE